MSMNPRETTEKIRTDYQEYISSILEVKDKEITRQARDSVKSTEFVKGPYLETTLPFVPGKSLKELVDCGLLSPEFSKMGKSVHYDEWQLRIHQQKALYKIIDEKRNMVVSTGTGSGKTECYLYPIFNELMREKENGTLDSGVRALLIFPMNALANDQQKKLRKLLKDYPDITFGRYTGETAHAMRKEAPEEAEKRLHDEYDASHLNDTDPDVRKSIKNELFCREMMAKTPPHILLTNYAMLEYMLLRPDTAPFFDNDSAKNWRFIVIDEAHTYKGATGTEIAFLLRRLKDRIRNNMHDSFRCIATSATLGSDSGKEDLARFAQALFDEEFTKDDVITTQRMSRAMPASCRAFDPAEYIFLKASVAGMSELKRGRFLYARLVYDTRLFSVYDALKSRPKRIEEVASSVFPDVANERDREKALVNLIELAAAARKDESESALLPARYHLFIKSLEGMFIQYIPRKQVFLDRKEKIYSGDSCYAVFELANCEKCNQEYLVGKTISFDGSEYFVQTSSHDKPDYYFISPNTGEDLLETFDEDDVIEESSKLSSLEKYHLCLSCGRITDFASKHPIDCCADTNPGKIATVYQLKYSGKDNESNSCPCCGATRKGLIKRFLTANQPATFTIGKSLYDAIPPRPAKDGHAKVGSRPDDGFFDDIFMDETDPVSSETEEILDESGRKLLIFSDNRQEAAFFAGSFEKKYLLIMWRKIILRCLSKAPGHTLNIRDLISAAKNEADNCGLYTMDQERCAVMTDTAKTEMAAHYIIQEFTNPDVMTGLEGLGYIQIYPDEMRMRPELTMANLKGQDVWNLFRFMMDTLRQKGAFNYPDVISATDDFFAPRNHYGYFRLKVSTTNRGNYIFGFIPADKVMNKRLSMISKLIHDSAKTHEENDQLARTLLMEVYNGLVRIPNYTKESTVDNEGSVRCLNYARWNVRLNDEHDIIYRCKKCGKIFHYSMNDICPEMKCDGTLEELQAKDVQKTPYYSQVYSDTKIIPMVAREHTAQLSSQTAGMYQKLFEEGKINVLSCSTTFEMGVDVGELEATFQRNVPPETSNYIQRAGRAGRRTSSAAFSVTFSRRNSHDITFFQNPAQIIAGKISAPILETDNEKIAQRHLNSIVVSWFFKKYPEFFESNTERILGTGTADSDMASVLRAALSAHPADLLTSIRNALPAKVYSSLDVDSWNFIEDLTGPEGSLTRAITERSADINGLMTFRSGLSPDASRRDLARVISADNLVSTLKSEPSITFLSAKGVLPKYGFPIDTVSLDIIGKDVEEAKKIDLARDLRMAISEFAPPAEIIANGKVWQSYSLNTVPDRTWPTYIYYVCPNCKRIGPPVSGVVDAMADPNDAPAQVCSSCGEVMNAKKFIIPLFGFSTSINYKPKSVGETRPRAYYATQTQFWGIGDITEKQRAESKECIKDICCKPVSIIYSPGGKLFVLNQGTNGRGLDVCPTCGYTQDPTKIRKPGGHKTKFDRACSTKDLINVSLGHEFSTDILKITLPKYTCTIGTGTDSPKDEYLSVMYAILEGASKALGISRDDISGCVTPNQEIILFDDTPGGSGFVKYIYSHIEEVLKEARNKVSGVCGCTEETSCYGCLRNFSNQFFHDYLSRGLAYEYLDWLLSASTSLPDPASPGSSKPAPPAGAGGISIGKKKGACVIKDLPIYDSISSLRILQDDSDDMQTQELIQKFIDKLDGMDNLEHPYIDKDIPLDINLWPDIFWLHSKVAVFLPDNSKQYEMLKKYDWYCYMLDEAADIDNIIIHIKEATSVGGKANV